MIADLATRLAGRTIGIEAHVLTVASHETLQEGGVETVQMQGLVERAACGEGAGEIETIREAAAISDLMFAALAEERFIGRTEREVAWRVRELFHEHGSSELAFDTIVAAAENGASPHAAVRDVEIPADTLVTIDAGCRVDGYCLGLHAHLRDGRSARRARARLRRVPRGAAGGLDAFAPGAAGVTWTQPRAM